MKPMNELRQTIDRYNKAKFGKKATFASLEREAKITNGTINKWEKHSPTLEYILKVADVLDVSIDVLCNREKEILPVSEQLSQEEQNLLKAWRAADKACDFRTLDNVAFLLREYGMPMPEKNNTDQQIGSNAG